MSAKFKRATTSRRDKYLENYWENQPKWQDERDKAVEDAVQAKADAKKIEAKTPNQQIYLDALKTKQLILVQGLAGTGKTFMATGYAVQLYREGVIKKILLTRTMTESGRRMGAFPGTPKEKFEPYLRQQLNYLIQFMSKEEVTRLIETDVIEIIPLEMLRGASLNDTFLIMDEAQNTEKEQMLLLLTRFGENSKFVICGDLGQNDLRLQSREYTPSDQTGFAFACRNLIGKDENIAVVELTIDDVVRSGIVRTILIEWAKGR